MYHRALKIADRLIKKSHFLLGPRATGKSWLVRNELPNAQFFDLLNLETYDRFLRRPHALSEEVTAKTVVIDEIQKLPQLLDEVHRLIEEKQIRFLLTGSSARKLKAGGANLLAGRARSLSLYPLTSFELTDFNLERYCNTGGLPIIWNSDDYWADLRSYVHLYMKEEIIAEAVVRKVDHYARFLDVVGARSGEELNFQRVAQDSGVPPRTVANFVEVLQVTLLAFELEPFQKTRGRKVVAKSKLYLFDVGVANYLAGRKEILLRSEAFGKAFEHFIIQEIHAYLGYFAQDVSLHYWRTQTGDFEVDCVVGEKVAIEIKSSERFQEEYLRGLLALKEEKKLQKYYLVSRDPIRRNVRGIEVLPFEEFLKRMWAHDLF
jgi:predicted AAA+ superfamily ATPase